MSQQDHDREELIRLLISICDYARLGYSISTCDNCNNCGLKTDCEHCPKAGQMVRWNCPLWVSER